MVLGICRQHLKPTMHLLDFADGRGWDGYVVGANAEFEIADGLTLRDNFNYVNGIADTFGFVPAGSAVTGEAAGGLETGDTADGHMADLSLRVEPCVFKITKDFKQYDYIVSSIKSRIKS